MALEFIHHSEQVEGTNQVVFIIAKRDASTLSDSLEIGSVETKEFTLTGRYPCRFSNLTYLQACKVDARKELGRAFEDLSELCFITEIDLEKDETFFAFLVLQTDDFSHAVK